MTTEPVQYTRFTLLKLWAQGGVGELPGRSRAGVKAKGRQQPRLDQWAPVFRRVGRAGMRRLLRGARAAGRGGHIFSCKEEVGHTTGGLGHCL